MTGKDSAESPGLGDRLQFQDNGQSRKAMTDVTIIPLTADDTVEEKVPLRGKVALIVGGASENGQSLAVAFAERGIDVALVYFNDRHELAERIKSQVEARQQRCMLISGNREEDEENDEFSRHVVLRILETLGRLDIFINYSARIFPFRYILEEETQQQRAIRKQIFPHFTMMKAALDQIIG
ncbi:MAG: SDR family NAD(P)-dependent oxidoreductase [Chloroflexota bacterium]